MYTFDMTPNFFDLVISGIQLIVLNFRLIGLSLGIELELIGLTLGWFMELPLHNIFLYYWRRKL